MDKNEGLLKQQIEDALKVVYAKKEVYKLEMEKAEGLFWDLTKDDTHTTDDELKHVFVILKSLRQGIWWLCTVS